MAGSGRQAAGMGPACRGPRLKIVGGKLVPSAFVLTNCEPRDVVSRRVRVAADGNLGRSRCPIPCCLHNNEYTEPRRNRICQHVGSSVASRGVSGERGDAENTGERNESAEADPADAGWLVRNTDAKPQHCPRVSDAPMRLRRHGCHEESLYV